MANYFPLIINPVGNIIQELPAADFLDLSQSGIANSGNITVSGVISATGNINGGNLSGTSIVGTLTTASQTNITAVGTLTSLAVTGNASSATAAADTNTTQLATTAYVIGQASSATPASIGTNTVGTSLRYARADHTHTGVASLANGGGITASTSTGAITLGSTATNANTASAIVARDASGNFSAGTITATLSGAATTAGTVTTAAQPNITSVGTLTSLAVTGNITSGNLSGTSIVGTLTTASQTNITAVGTLTSLAVTGNITSGNLSGTSIVGTLTTASQTNITAVGTLGSLAVTGNASSATAAADTNTTQLATTAYVVGQASAATPASIGTNTVGTSLRYARADHTHTGVSTITTSSGLSTNTNATGAVSITNTGVLSLANGGGITASASSGAITLGSNATSTGVVNTLVSRDTSGNFSANIITATLNGGAATAATVTTAAQPNITSVGILTAMTTSSSVTVNNLNSQPTVIINGGTNGVGNIGSPAATFNTVFARATTAQYADLAENYAADAEYEPGTVLIFGGAEEVTVSTKIADSRVVGVVTTNPAYLMNTGLASDYPVSVALIGRVPVKVIGPVTKGDFMVSAPNGYAQACASPTLGTVIGKAIQDFSGTIGVIEVLINNQ